MSTLAPLTGLTRRTLIAASPAPGLAATTHATESTTLPLRPLAGPERRRKRFDGSYKPTNPALLSQSVSASSASWATADGGTSTTSWRRTAM